MLGTEQILGKEITGKNSEHLEELRERVTGDRVTWVLGAGVSKSVGVPLWSECLLRMWARILLVEREDTEQTEFQKTLNELKKKIAKPDIFLGKVNSTIAGKSSIGILGGVNTLEAAEYIQNFITEALQKAPYYSTDLRDRVYADLVRDALKPKGKPDEIFSKLKDGVLGLLAEHFIQKVREDKKTEVITYNFDGLLEFALEKKGLAQKDCHIKNPGTANVIENERGVHIYHPHGTVSVVPTKFSAESKRLVLAESSYEQLERKTYIWENSIQAKALQSTSCVFLGFSGEDYNFRRIIKNMESEKEKQNIQHYIFMSIETMVKTIFREEINRKLLGNEPRTEEERKKYLDSIDTKKFDDALSELLSESCMVYERMLIIKKLDAQSKYWRNYNIVPIWTTRGELTGMVRQILGD